MRETVNLSGDYYAIGLPENAMDHTVYGIHEMHKFLGANESRIRKDIENDEWFLMFYRSVNTLKSAVELIAKNRETLRKIFSPEEIMSMDDLGYWRVIYKTSDLLQCLPGKNKKKVTNNVFGPHYSIEARESNSFIRAKGSSYNQAEGLFLEAAGNVLI